MYTCILAFDLQQYEPALVFAPLAGLSHCMPCCAVLCGACRAAAQLRDFALAVDASLADQLDAAQAEPPSLKRWGEIVTYHS